MAHTAHTISYHGLVSRALQWIWDSLIAAGENSARARVAHQISELTDAELAARGLTKADLTKRVLSDGYHL